MVWAVLSRRGTVASSFPEKNVKVARRPFFLAHFYFRFFFFFPQRMLWNVCVCFCRIYFFFLQYSPLHPRRQDSAVT